MDLGGKKLASGHDASPEMLQGTAAAGLVLGLVAGGFAVRLMRNLLYGANPLDLGVFAAVAGILMLVAFCACVVPAWRASRMDPMRAIRTE